MTATRHELIIRTGGQVVGGTSRVAGGWCTACDWRAIHAAPYLATSCRAIQQEFQQHLTDAGRQA